MDDQVYLIECIVDLFPNVSAKAEKFAVDSMENRLEKVSFAWIFTVEQIE